MSSASAAAHLLWWATLKPVLRATRAPARHSMATVSGAATSRPAANATASTKATASHAHGHTLAPASPHAAAHALPTVSP